MNVNEACRSISELAPNAQKACRLFLKRCEEENLKVRITETYRSQERQNWLYTQGRTRKGKIVTWTKNSRHTSRRAWDICKDIKGQEYSDSTFFKACGTVAKSLGIIWGGTWKQADTPHFEITTDWKESEDKPMTQQERTKFNALVEAVEGLTHTVDRLADRITKLESPMIYNYIDKNMPEWARPTVQKLVDNRILKGNENGCLNLDMGMLRILVVLDRSGAFDK